MKKLGLILLLLCAFSTVAEAQVNRQLSRVPDSQTHKKKQRAQADPLADFMKKLTEDLELNSLQQAAIHDIFERQISQLKSIHEEERISDNEKMDRANAIIDKNEETIMALLDPEQQKKFTNMKEKAKKRR